MVKKSHISLEQWRVFVTVVQAGGYAKAAERLHKSQSSVTYAIQKLESALDVSVFSVEGRKAQLTKTGELLYRRAEGLLEEAAQLERSAHIMSAGWEAEIRLAVEILFPTRTLLSALDQFGVESPHSRIELFETVLGGTSEALIQGQADLAITPQVPPGFLGDPLIRLRLVAVAQPDHPLHHLGRSVRSQDLSAFRQLVVRESGSSRVSQVVWVEAAQRWTVTQMATSIEAVKLGYGFAWLPEAKIREDLNAGTLKPLPLREGAARSAQLYLVFAEPDYAGPGTLRLAEILREKCALGSSSASPPSR